MNTETLMEVEVRFGLVRAIILVKSPKKTNCCGKLGNLTTVSNSFPTSGQFDAVAIH